MPQTYVVTTSYPRHASDAEGHFVAAEVRRLLQTSDVTVLAPGLGRAGLHGERVVSLGGGDAFGFPGALERLRIAPWRALAAGGFVGNAVRWLRRAPRPARLQAHFLLPCGVPIATRGLAAGATPTESESETEIEIVVHGSDARLFARLPLGQRWLGAELVRGQARLRFVSSELENLVLSSLPREMRAALEPRCRVEPCAIDLPNTTARAQARSLVGIDADARIAVIVARLVPGKRVHVALQACERVAGLQSIVVGEGPERQPLMQRFPNARFVGHVERPLALTYVAAADVLVSASLAEGAPTVVREARALGTEVVCLEAGDLRSWAERDAGIHVV